MVKLAVVCDLVEEGWPSMDLVAEMLLENLRNGHADSIIATRVCPPMRKRLVTIRPTSRFLFNTDRLVNRLWDYPRHVSRLRHKFDLFHLVDHSYSQLVHYVRPDRTVITCHDLDTFRCLLEPQQDQRSWPFSLMTKYILSGFRKAAKVVCDSNAVREQLLAYGLFPQDRVEVVTLGTHPVYSPKPNALADAETMRLLSYPQPDNIGILHVGSTIARKRIDILLRVFNSLRREFPAAKLIRIGGPFTESQSALIEQLNLAESIIVLSNISRDVLASIYRRATLVLQPSEREGFGFPVVEAMACGTPVVASDINVLREVGGDAVTYCPMGDVCAWSEKVTELLNEKSERPEQWNRRSERGVEQASKFSWAEYTRKMVSVYERLL